jgi:hypothetical protein
MMNHQHIRRSGTFKSLRIKQTDDFPSFNGYEFVQGDYRQVLEDKKGTRKKTLILPISELKQPGG